MERSLLMLLEKEDKAVEGYNTVNRNIDILERELKRLISIPIECESKAKHIEVCINDIAQYKSKALERATEIVQARNEIKQYLKEIF